MMGKHSVKVNSHTTSVTLEDEFWKELKVVTKNKGISLSAMISDIDKKRRPEENLCSAIRVFILQELKKSP